MRSLKEVRTWFEPEECLWIPRWEFLKPEKGLRVVKAAIAGVIQRAFGPEIEKVNQPLN